MTDKALAFQELPRLLRRPADDAAVLAVIGGRTAKIRRSAQIGYVARKSDGVSIMFKEAAWLVEPSKYRDPRALHVSAFHLHRDGHEGHSQYEGALPGGIAFGDRDDEIVRKLGQPEAKGGGGWLEELKMSIPHWLRYQLGDATLHLQVDAERRLEMVTLQVEDLK
jgi:hypothetical protein